MALRSFPLLSTDTPAYPQSLHGEQHSQHVFLFSSFLGWGETEPIWYVATNRPIIPAPNDMSMEHLVERPKYSEETRPEATLSTTNPT
jgi:hypothetical protein